ncbi:uncharacterized protein LOC128677216 isoform X2 [Plodia interpunctella]|uniref:uncharacterized protein LOC128677216 isoform X2 n=1 Tax=Plodia interpunctella TaxID=58824 RepID=UPI0023675BA7|nr:uncharacterized protein LOC128677216 isoform X2 [Plodia interpunctella]
MAAVQFGLLLTVISSFVYSQHVNNVRLVNHREYMTEVLTAVAHILEERQWCNLKIPEFQMDVDQNILNWDVSGTVSFQNGFTVSIQRLEILESSLNQIWSWNNVDGTGTVEVRGTLRMHDLTVGFDVVADFGEIFRSSATYRHPLITFAFSIFRNTQTLATSVTVVGTQPRSLNKLQFLPTNNATDVINALYDSNITFTGITSWSEVFQPIALDVVTNRISFPVICYNCPIT